jgi:hypothetical protein
MDSDQFTPWIELTGQLRLSMDFGYGSHVFQCDDTNLLYVNSEKNKAYYLFTVGPELEGCNSNTTNWPVLLSYGG